MGATTGKWNLLLQPSHYLCPEEQSRNLRVSDIKMEGGTSLTTLPTCCCFFLQREPVLTVTVGLFCFCFSGWKKPHTGCWVLGGPTSNVSFTSGCLPFPVLQGRAWPCHMCDAAGSEVYFWRVARWPPPPTQFLLTCYNHMRLLGGATGHFMSCD